MKVGKAEELVAGLQAPQKHRLRMFTGNLSTDKDPGVFDDKMFEYISEVVTDAKWVKDKLNYLNSIGWNQSKYDFSQIREQAKRFAEPNHSWFGWNENYRKAKERRIQEAEKFILKSLQFTGNGGIAEYLPREDTHAGWAYILTGKKQKGEYREGLLQCFEEEVRQAKEVGSFNKPILPGTRTQASNPFNDDGSYNNDYRDKSRLVSMVDIYQVMAEVVFAKRLQTKFSSIPWYAGGKNDRIIMYYMSNWKREYQFWLSIDYSKFDQSISDWMIRDAFDVVRAAYKYDELFDDRLFDIVREDFINKVIVLGENEMYQSNKGVPSGSMFTQLIDSIVNRLMIDTYMLSVGIEDYQMMIMGDDNIIFTNKHIDAQHLSTYLGKNFGIEMNPDKCGEGRRSERQDPEFLSRKWTDQGVYRLPELLLAKLMFPERFRDYKSNPDLHPSMIVQCYIDSFPLGMEFISYKHRRKALTQKDVIGDGRWLTGLMRYRLLYAS